MRRKVSFFVGFIGFLLVLFGVIKIFGGRASKQGVLKVESSHESSVFLNNKHIGRTPYENKADIGEHTIKIVPDAAGQDVGSWQGKITLSANRLTYVRADLSQSELTAAVDVLWLEKSSSREPEISIISNPDGATVLIDDVTKGITPLAVQDIQAGDHSLTVTSPGFLSRTLKIKTTEGYKLNAMVKMALAPGGSQASDEGVVEPTKTAAEIKEQDTEEITTPYALIDDTPTGFLRVRLEPTTSSSEAAKVNPGEKYSILDSENGWYKIEYQQGKTGWISGQYAEKVE